VNDVANVGVNMVLHGQATDKLNAVVVNTSSTPNSVPVVDDVEFSDTEDMLEGIRNVVDKVSIEEQNVNICFFAFNEFKKNFRKMERKEVDTQQFIDHVSGMRPYFA